MNGLAYYNEIDPFAAQWLRNLIAAGHIAPGVVDTRSIEDVSPNELKKYTQCHFFAGIGVWSVALRRSGWPDNRPVWTGSCPCQPFSAAGKSAGFSDERHLWPAFHWLISQCRPSTVYGEQVASKSVEPWIDLVQTDLEALDYAFGCVPFPSAGVGAPHIRDRTYWAGHTDESGPQGYTGNGGAAGREGSDRPVASSGLSGGLGDTHCEPTGRDAGATYAAQTEHGSEKSERYRSGDAGDTFLSGMAKTKLQQRQGSTTDSDEARGRDEESAALAGLCSDSRPGPTNGFWRDADWLFCRDDKWRPVEPGTFPLADGTASRVGRLRAYGNAINVEAARVFIEATAPVDRRYRK